MYKTLVLGLIALFVGYSCDFRSDDSSAIHLTCEHLHNPMGIDVQNPRLAWQMQDDRKGARQSAWQIWLDADASKVEDGKKVLWNSGVVASDQMLVSYNGPQLDPFTTYHWKVRIWDANGRPSAPSETAFFTTGLQTPSNWKGAWISDTRDIHKKEAPYFRKEFSIDKKVQKASAYIAAAGLFELFVNGRKVGDHFLDPMYTRFDRRILYLSHDVTEMLSNGINALGIILGNGWYNHQSTAVWYFHEAPWRGRPSFCMDLLIEYEDGSKEIIRTGTDWKTSEGSVIFNSIYTAEHHDARKAQEHWHQPGFDDSEWKSSILMPAPSQNIVSQAMHPIRLTQKIDAKSITPSGRNTWIVDFGRNIAGITEISIRGDEGTLVEIEHAERLNKDGSLDMSNINAHYRPTDDSDPFQTDIYTLRGSGQEVFRPKFNYKGFQYAEIRSNKPIEFDITAYFIHSDVPARGSITASNPIIEKMWWASNNSYLSNLHGYPTDCPQREKNGWTGDAHIAIETALYNFDGITVYEKWLADHRDEQQPNGVLPAIIPTSGWGYHWANGPDWTSTIALIPWNIYLFYGDTRLLEECYDNIKRYVDYINYTYPSGLTTWGLGDWVPVKSRANVELTSTAYYYTDVRILMQAAKLFGKDEDASYYAALAKKIQKAFNDTFYDKEKGLYASGLQTELSVPLMWGLVEPGEIEKVAANLAARVAADGNQIDVGLLGTKAILNALSENGYPDLAYTLASRETYPSWGWWIVNGATTFYENWDIESGRDISLNHIMFGEVNAWFYKALGGIKPDPTQPGFRNILLEPHFVKGLEHFTARHKGPYGEIVSSWKRENGKIIYEVVIPPNSSATVTLPESARPEGEKITPIQTAGSVKTFEIKAGKYVFGI